MSSHDRGNPKHINQKEAHLYWPQFAMQPEQALVEPM